jgi:cytidine deaminase
MSDQPSEETWDALVRTAIEARKNAYAPYSNFTVGAALLTTSGEIFPGCNVEIASIGATTCAERNAVHGAVGAGHRTLAALCVLTDLDPPGAPCGICRQVLAEFSDELPILLVNPAGDRRHTSLDELLPLRFSGRDFLNLDD